MAGTQYRVSWYRGEGYRQYKVFGRWDAMRRCVERLLRNNESTQITVEQREVGKWQPWPGGSNLVEMHRKALSKRSG